MRCTTLMRASQSIQLNFQTAEQRYYDSQLLVVKSQATTPGVQRSRMLPRYNQLAEYRPLLDGTLGYAGATWCIVIRAWSTSVYSY